MDTTVQPISPQTITHIPAAELHRRDQLVIHPDPAHPEVCRCCTVLGVLVHDGVVDVALLGVRALTLPAGLMVEVIEAGEAA